MKKAIGIKLTEEDYDMSYDGTEGSQSIMPDKVEVKTDVVRSTIDDSYGRLHCVQYSSNCNHIELPGNNISSVSGPFSMPFNP